MVRSDMYNVIGVFLGLVYASVFLAGYILMFDLLRAVYTPDARFFICVTAALLWPLTFVVCMAVLVPGVVVFLWDVTRRFVRGARDLLRILKRSVDHTGGRQCNTGPAAQYSVKEASVVDG